MGSYLTGHYHGVNLGGMVEDKNSLNSRTSMPVTLDNPVISCLINSRQLEDNSNKLGSISSNWD